MRPSFKKIKVLLPPCAAEMERGAAFSPCGAERRSAFSPCGFGRNFSACAAFAEFFAGDKGKLFRRKGAEQPGKRQIGAARRRQPPKDVYLRRRPRRTHGEGGKEQKAQGVCPYGRAARFRLRAARFHMRAGFRMRARLCLRAACFHMRAGLFLRAVRFRMRAASFRMRAARFRLQTAPARRADLAREAALPRAQAASPNTIIQIEKKRNQIAGVGGICRPENAHRGDGEQRRFQRQLHRHPRRHRTGGRPGPAAAREAGGKGLRRRQQDGGRRQRPHQPRKQAAFFPRDRAEEKGARLPRECQQKRRRGKGYKQGAFEGEGDLSPAASAPRPRRRHGGHDGRRQPVTDGGGQVDEGGSRPREQPVLRRGVYARAREQADDEHAVGKVRQGQHSRRRGDGQGDAEDGLRRRRGGGVQRLFCGEGKRDQKQQGEQLARRDREQRIRDRAVHVRAEHIGKREPERRLDRLFRRLRKRRGQEVVPALKPAAETGDERHQKHGGRQHAVRLRRRGLALQGADAARRRQHQQAPRPADGAEQQQGAGKHPARGDAARLPYGHDARKPRRHPRRGERQQQAVQRVDHLIYAHPLPAEQVGERDAVERAQNFGGDAARRHDDRPLDKRLLHMYGIGKCGAAGMPASTAALYVWNGKGPAAEKPLHNGFYYI